ncbi:DNA-methyltransferase, partial [Syntrophomonas wolfei]
WCYGGGSGTRRHFHRKHDQILWYGKGKDYTFNPQYRPYTEGTLQRGLTRVKGKKYKLHKEGALLQDWWVDINKILSPTARENLKFPTQKPLALLKRIIASASNPGDLAADFYAGSGTTAEACEEMNRSWISCDSSKLAIQSSRYRLLRKKARPFQITELIDEGSEGQKQGILDLIVPEVCSYDEKQAMVKLGISRYDSPLFPFENRNFVSCLDFWELDWDYDGCFSSQLQVIREKPDYNLPLPLQLSILLPKQKEYRMAIKSYDIFGHSIIKSFAFSGCK